MCTMYMYVVVVDVFTLFTEGKQREWEGERGRERRE